jgi:uncharacterized protein (DUF1800 family)
MIVNPQSNKAADPWTPYEPDASRPWNLHLAGHLYRRAGFGATWGQLQQALADGPQRTVDRLLRPEADAEAFNRDFDQYDTAVARSGSAEGLRAWWLRRMIETPHPLLEKMTLFWHGHFAASNAKVKSGQLMAHHVRMLRTHALGKYRPLLEAASRDPAMFLGLDSVANRKAVPNDNFARQLMERLTLGPGHFDEQDVHEASRAFTGWFVRRNQLLFVPREHDEGTKKILGQAGKWTVEDVLKIALEQPTVSQMLVRKLYRWLISETDEPDDALLAPLVESFDKDYDVGRMVETMLRSNQFFSEAAYRRRIKSPVEYALGIVRGLEGSVSTARLGQDLAELGQNLFHPPTVRGWEGGRHWINSATLVSRSNLALALLATTGPYENKLDPIAVAKRYNRSAPKSAAGFVVDLFLQGDVAENVHEAMLEGIPSAGDNASKWLRQFTHSVVTLPEFHLC